MYFLISPLTEAQSELLSRTTPTLWDVLIALFGGFAGIVGATRREKSNVIPGVAIATALMPPLCTAGYGLAKGNLSFFVGAFYLFAVNGIFIASATVVVISLLKLPHRQYVDQATERRVREKRPCGGAVASRDRAEAAGGGPRRDEAGDSPGEGSRGRGFRSSRAS